MTNEKMKPVQSVPKPIPEISDDVNSMICSSVAPRIAGTAKRNEKRAAFPRDTPIKRALLIVNPERDIPGRMAMA